ncbi:hypothetical protein [Paenibacillus durus]|uniref:Uncharacterized protein n=1 Tax=Paenibacillus durus TaxID=44251 RepID=A0A089HWJ3_PAEDU|nr:hypothetical protein [Paenibacillus durus]AIQ14758.1 hypothetical protein PDUR_24925 [Paenibacillus durus]
MTLLVLTGCLNTNVKAEVVIVPMKVMYSAWQGVASNGKYIYITSDRDKNFRLSNTISIYTNHGEFIKSIPNAYTKTDSSGKFMSFGDCTFINGFLYVTAYNFNSGAKRTISKIVKYKLPDIKMVKEYKIGEGTAESVVQNGGFYWVVYHDRNYIAEFDSKFNLIHRFPLSQHFGKEGGYQGIIFIGNDLLVNLHGSNKYNEEYAQGLDHYRFNGYKFDFIERIKPPAYGTGQGIEFFGGKYYWTDRPGNSIVITDKLK